MGHISAVNHSHNIHLQSQLNITNRHPCPWGIVVLNLRTALRSEFDAFTCFSTSPSSWCRLRAVLRFPRVKVLLSLFDLRLKVLQLLVVVLEDLNDDNVSFTSRNTVRQKIATWKLTFFALASISSSNPSASGNPVSLICSFKFSA